MQAIIFCGVQATGKTTFFLKHFFKTHIRISLDQLNTRHKETVFLNACLSVQQPFVVDNTNPSREDRKKYIELAKAKKFKAIGYYFQSKLEQALERNASRAGKECIPELGIRGTYKKLEIPILEEGFDELYYVELEGNAFTVKSWNHEI